MFQYHCLNPIAEKGLGLFDEEYKKSEDLQECDAVLVRSAKMHDMELPESVKVIARAGAGVNNIPVKDCAEKGVVVFNTGRQCKRCEGACTCRYAPCFP